MLTPEEYDKKQNARRLREGLENHIRHIARRGTEKYGTIDTLERLETFLADPEVVRFPTAWAIDSDGLAQGEAVRLDRRGEGEAERYVISVHPRFAGRAQEIILLVLYTVVRVNYGKIAKARESLLFASSLLGRTAESCEEEMKSVEEEIAFESNKG